MTHEDATPPISGAALADAAVWLARLGSEDRSREDEQRLRRWLAESEEHRRAFLEVSACWEAAGGISDPADLSFKAPRYETRRAVLAGAAASATIVAAAGGWRLWASAPESTVTEVGEVRRIALADGTALTLDTDSRVDVRLTSSWRTVDLVRGRAYFDVAADRTRPFVVRAAGRTVTALGTAFDVAREPGGVTVLLVEGRVAVQPAEGIDRSAARLMAPGDRLSLRQGELPRLDRPDIAAAVAWQQGQLVFENCSLSEAVAEMNRYSRYRHLSVEEAIADRRVSGSYATQNIESFARSVARLIGGEVEMQDDQIVLRALSVRPGKSVDSPDTMS